MDKWSRSYLASLADRVACVVRTRANPSLGLVVERSFGMADFDGKLFAVGGYRISNTALSTVETLSSASGAWVLESNTLNVARGLCVGDSSPYAMIDGLTYSCAINDVRQSYKLNIGPGQQPLSKPATVSHYSWANDNYTSLDVVIIKP